MAQELVYPQKICKNLRFLLFETSLILCYNVEYFILGAFGIINSVYNNYNFIIVLVTITYFYI